MSPAFEAMRSASLNSASASSREMPRRHPYWSRKPLAVTPSAVVSADSGSESASSRTLRQCVSAWLGSLVPAHAAARACQRAASSFSPGGLPVLREQRRPLVEPLRILLGDRPSDRCVDRGAALAELRAVGDLLGQRVLERVERPRGRAPARRRTRPRPAREARPRAPAVRAPTTRASTGSGNSLPITAAACSTAFSRCAEPVDARREHGLHARRHRRVLDRAREPVGAALALEAAGLDQRLDHLLDEERVARGPLADQLRQPVERGVGAEQVGEQLARSPRGRAGRGRSAGSTTSTSTAAWYSGRKLTTVEAARALDSPRPGWRGTPRSPGRASAGPRTR